MIQAVIFDVDGTLLNTERIAMGAWKAAGQRLGYDIPDRVLLATRGVSRKDGVAIFRAEFGTSFPYEELLAIRVQIAEEIIHSRDLVMAGVRNTLEELSCRGIPMAVASSTKFETTREHLEHFGLLHYFGAVIGGDMITHGKPAPDIFLKAASTLGADPHDCLVVEDSPAGVRAAAAAHMQVVLIPDSIPANPETTALSMAVLHSMEELIDLIAPHLPH